MTDAFSEQKRLMRLGAMASVMVAITLIAAKGYAWWLSGSVSLLGSLADSSLDFLASAVTLFAIIIALRPADADHRFGHGKAEAIAGLFQTSIIFGSSAFLIYSSIERIRNPVPIEEGMLGVYVSIFAIFLTLGLVTFQKKVISKTRSVAISADRLHYVGDLLLNVAVIAALLLASVGGFHAVDGYFGLGIALYIGWNAYQISRTSIDMLMDKEFDSAEREKIFNLVLGSPAVKGIHDLKTRRSGLNVFIQFHIELDPDLNLFEAHHIADEVEATVGEEFPNSEIIIHTDPLGLERAETQDELGRDK
ncbi:MAG: cation diffusion facilitator family transporter [Sphingomonadales bacterium]